MEEDGEGKEGDGEGGGFMEETEVEGVVVEDPGGILGGAVAAREGAALGRWGL